MRITISKLFELFQLPQELRTVQPLVDFVNTSVEQLTKALQGRLTLRDNMACEIRTLEFKPSGDTYLPQTFTPSKRNVEGVLLLGSTSEEGNTLNSFQWEWLTSGALRITPYPRNAYPTRPLQAKFVVLYADA